VALVGVVLWGTLTGSVLPFLAKRLGFDPEASSRRSSRPWSTSPDW
jgi:magnesium transporter